MSKKDWQLMLVLLLAFPLAVVAAPKQAEPPVSQFEEPLQPFQPKKPRSESEQDKIISAAHYAHGRMLLKREDFSGALRRFQRAWRYQPDSISILSQIVPLAFELKHNEEAARYAVLMAEKDPRDPHLLQRLAMHLTQQRDWKKALALYEKSIELLGDAEPDAALIISRMEMGRLYFLTEDFKKSADCFTLVRDALQEPERFSLTAEQKKLLLGKADLTYTLLAESFLLAGRIDDASAMFQKANQAKPNEDLLAFRLARIDVKQEKLDAALKKLEQYFQAQLSAAQSAPYQLLDEILSKKHKEKKEATRLLIKRLTELNEDDPANAALGYFLAERLHSSGQLDKAESIYVDLLKLQPAIDGHRALIEIYQKQGKLDKMLSALGRAVEAVGSLELLGETAEKITKEVDLAGKLIDLARKKQSSDPPSLQQGEPLAAAMLAISLKNYDAADLFFEAALAAARVKPRKAQVMMTWGLEMFMAEQAGRAAVVFQRSIDEKVLPENNQAFYYYLAGALEFDGKTDQAIAAAKQASKLDPSSARFHSREAWIYYHAKRYEKAEELYQKLLDRFDADHQPPENRDVMRESRLVLSNISVHREDMPTAEDWLEQVLDEFPEHIGALNDLGYLWADQNKHLKRSLGMIRQAVEAEPDNIAYRDSLGWVYFRMGQFNKAVQELQQAAAGENPDGVILDHLGDAHLKNKQTKKAIAAWKRAIKEFKADDDKKMMQATQAKIKKHAEK